jgi:hypothetical protein
MNIVTVGRTDTADYFNEVILANAKLEQTPVLAFIKRERPDGLAVEVRIIQRPADIADLPNDTPLMGQWRGQWRSDFFQFTAGELKTYATEHPRQVYYNRAAWGLPPEQ